MILLAHCFLCVHGLALRVGKINIPNTLPPEILTPTLFSPPHQLQNLQVGESLNPIEGLPFLSIKRVAMNPPMYIFRGILCHNEDRQGLIESSLHAAGMELAETKSGAVSHRSGSYMAWVSPEEEGRKDDANNRGHLVAQFMTNLNRDLFVSHDEIFSEHVQVVRYEKGGKFDLHHDGFGRIVTVLHYLNGVAGTWFPFCHVQGTMEDDDNKPPETIIDQMNMIKTKCLGKDGVWIVGTENSEMREGPHVIRVNPGDAVAFYNYENMIIDGSSSPVTNWRSLHAGMPTNQEKWIATNWFRLYEDEE